MVVRLRSTMDNGGGDTYTRSNPPSRRRRRRRWRFALAAASGEDGVGVGGMVESVDRARVGGLGVGAARWSKGVPPRYKRVKPLVT